MTTHNVKIWMWLENGKVFKAVAYPELGVFIVYDETNTVLIKRTGVTPEVLHKIQVTMSLLGAKQVDENQEPFTYL
jgi:hypothetical protein